MTAFWAVVVLCHGLDGAPPCLTHHVGPLDRLSCGPTVAALKLELAADRAWCTSNLPSGSTPLPAATNATNAATSPTTSQSPCGTTDAIEAWLGGKWREYEGWHGLSASGAVMQLWTSDADTWSLVERYADGHSCVRAVGKASSGVPMIGSRINLER